MLEDLVIDTNVFLHADDPRQGDRQVDAKALLDRLLEVSTCLAVDEGFDVDPARNRSHIGHEYLTYLTGVSTGMQVVVALATNDRLKVTPKRVDQPVRDKIKQLIKEKTDRPFLAVACNTASRKLCSHDFTDFQKSKRKTISKDLNVDVCEAVNVLEMLDDCDGDPTPSDEAEAA